MDALTKNFNRAEFACKCGCGLDTINPRLVERLQGLRDRIDKPIKILSGLRCPAHNKKVGGVRDSQHSQGNAADIHVSGLSISELAKLVYADELLSKGGVGVYPKRGFIHVDVRGKKARWKG